ncbi:MAG: hypothetical protein QY321_03130 [Patescibacteria group bacterium]|nr:MAG: hypothetical protein QY321_03130 [Patescibacteria group bacterium]
MKANCQTKKLEEMSVAWLVQWGFHAEDEDEQLKRLGIKRRVIDVISVRKKFKDIIEIAKNIYKMEVCSFSEKIFLSHYNLERKREGELFGGSVPLLTHFQSDLYRKLGSVIDQQGLESIEAQKLRDKWKKYPQYVIVGHNPYLEISEVYNLSLYRKENGSEILEWDRQLINGETRREKYES